MRTSPLGGRWTRTHVLKRGDSESFRMRLCLLGHGEQLVTTNLMDIEKGAHVLTKSML